VLHHWTDQHAKASLNRLIYSGEGFLLSVQNEYGSWGGGKGIPGTIEETALAVSALSMGKHDEVCSKAMDWLDGFYRKNGLKASPIGLYFASLWYDEKMYPLTAYLDAVARMVDIKQ
jgi:squalene-hopene/tetraprenyl-beta-curcumene cyclase